MNKNKLKPIDVSKYTVTDTGQVLKMNKEVEVIQRPTYAELEKEVEELEAQIEKMKNCAKCAHCNTYITSCIPQKRFVRLEDVCEDFELRR